MISGLLVRTGVLTLPLLAPAGALAQGVTIDHQEIGCIVAGQYPKMNACFAPASLVKKPRVYFRPETLTDWYYVEMSSNAPCHLGILLRPDKKLIGKTIFYYVDAQGGSARTPEYAPVVVASAAECKTRLPVAPLSATGPAAVYPSFPPTWFVGGGGISAGVVAGGVAAVAVVTGGTVLLTNDDNTAATTPATVPATTPPATTPPATVPPGTVPPTALVVACRATPRDGEVPLRVDFATFPAGGTGVYAFQWTFGDGAGATNPNPSHTFTTTGTFDATVHVTSGGQTAACSRAITVTRPAPPPPPATFKLNVSLKGSGTGTVTGPGIKCPTDCSETYPAGTVVDLTATPDSTRVPTVFKDWSGDCTGTVNPCVLTMTADKNVTAQFELIRSLNVAGGFASSDAGSVGSSPPGITCVWGLAAPCTDSATFINGTTVTLTVITGGATILWGGCTPGPPTVCNVLMDANKNVSVDATTPFAPVRTSSGVPLVLSTVLEVPDGEGQVVMNGRIAASVRPGLAAMAAEGRTGANRVEAVLVRGAGRSGTWRFDLSGQAAFESGSLRVVAGTVVLITPDAVVFRLQGKPGERVVFTFEVDD